MTPSVGTQAPLDITVFSEEETLISLRDTLGSFVVLFFYPKDATPGCTIEACSFRDSYTELTKLGVRVIGISSDSVASHRSFKAAHSLPFELWSDPERKLGTAFGAVAEKKFFGKTFTSTKRNTIALNPEGTILKIWESVSPLTHTAEVTAFFANLMR